MKASLRLEVVGDPYARTAQASLGHVLKKLRRAPREHALRMLTPGMKPWVAKVDGFDRRGPRRVFVEGLTDYTQADELGMRGIHRMYVLEEGPVYEVNEVQGWTGVRRYFCRAEAGEVAEVPVAEVARRFGVAVERIQAIVDKAQA